MKAAICYIHLLTLFFVSSGLRAQIVSSLPVGFVKMEVAYGSGTTRGLSVLSFPMQETARITGQVHGRITGVTLDSITNANAGWTPGALSAGPCLIRITSGSAAGLTLLISSSVANSATTVAIEAPDVGSVNLTTLGIATGTLGDTYSILNADTLSSVFGTPASSGIQGGPTSVSADIVQLFVSGAWRQYYFCTSGTGNWRRVGPNSVSDNVVIRPDAGVIYSRLGAKPLSFMAAGEVPSAYRKTPVARSGVSFISSFWPVSVRLADMNIAAIPGWISSSTPVDLVQLRIGNLWRQYFFNGSNWREVGSNTLADDLLVPAASAFMLQRKSALAGADPLAQTAPYAF